MTATSGAEALAAAEKYEVEIVRFLRDLVAIPAETGHEGPVIERIKAQCGLARVDKCLIYAPDALGTRFIGKHPEIFAAVSCESLTPM